MHLQTFVFRIGAAALLAAGIAACTTTPLPPMQQPGRTATPPPQRQALFIRPAAGTTIGRFDGVRNKGVDIAGNLGDPIVASADGRVVYVGNELAAYGNMVIVKHNDTLPHRLCPREHHPREGRRGGAPGREDRRDGIGR
ncbi:peptidoglycan DD-metalloendopeptidase family protein [Variovorax sp. UC122_21]|uniref:peptidoglycan DD-metalloendopeptidase family protein n=1 Tax=Variovorax sp. UC122_21 TaxID=3374554 RepID=UPI00375843E9